MLSCKEKASQALYMPLKVLVACLKDTTRLSELPFTADSKIWRLKAYCTGSLLTKYSHVLALPDILACRKGR